MEAVVADACCSMMALARSASARAKARLAASISGSPNCACAVAIDSSLALIRVVPTGKGWILTLAITTGASGAGQATNCDLENTMRREARSAGAMVPAGWVAVVSRSMGGRRGGKGT